MRVVRVPAASPDDQAAKVRAAVGAVWAGLAERGAEGKRRCRARRQAEVEPLLAAVPQLGGDGAHVVPVRESV